MNWFLGFCFFGGFFFLFKSFHDFINREECHGIRPLPIKAVWLQFLISIFLLVLYVDFVDDETPSSNTEYVINYFGTL